MVAGVVINYALAIIGAAMTGRAALSGVPTWWGPFSKADRLSMPQRAVVGLFGLVMAGYAIWTLLKVG
jgi:hypothetical protein